MKRKNKILLVSVSLFVSFATLFLASQKARPKKTILWDSWYTVTLGSKNRYAYYHEKAELVDKQLKFSTKMWKLENGFINQEHIGTLSKNTADLQPDFYNMIHIERGTEKQIDATMNGKVLQTKVRQSGKNLPPAQQVIPKGAFFSTVFPMWLGKNASAMKPKTPVPFTTITEGVVHQSPQKPRSGTVYLDSPDTYAKKTSTKRLQVQLGGQGSTWWILPSGEVQKIYYPKTQALVQKTTKKKAQGFLKN